MVVRRINEKEYNDPIIPVITIKNRANNKTLLEHDISKENDTLLSPFGLSVESGIKKTGSFTLKVYDDYGYIRSGLIPYRGRVNIKAKKPHQTQYTNLINGLILNIQKLESYNNGDEIWEISGQSMKHILGHTHIRYSRNIPFLNLKENKLNLKNTDPKYWVGNVFNDILTNRTIFPNNNGYNLLERGDFTANGVSKDIPLTIPSVNFTGTADDLLGQLADNVGCIYGVDEDNDIYLKFPTFSSTGHVIKTKTSIGDSTDYTMYTRADISTGTSVDSNVYAEVIIGEADSSSIVSNNSSTNSYTSLFNKDIAVQIDLRSTELYDLTFILSKLNAGTDSDNPENTNLRGFIAADNKNQIGKDVVAEISIALRDIPSTPEPISRRNLKFKRPIDPTQKYWLVLQEIGNSENNTVLWWHDNGSTAKAGIQTYAAIRDIPYGRGATEAYIPNGWIYLKNKQVYSNTFTLRSPILHVSNVIYNGNPDDYLDKAPVETVQSPTYISDTAGMMQFSAIFNENVSRIIQSYDFGEVSIPDKLPRPGISVVYLNTRNIQQPVSITDIAYDFGVGEGQVFGTNNCKISGVGYIMPTAGDNLGSIGDMGIYYCS